MSPACLPTPVCLYGELCTERMNVHLVLHLHNISGNMCFKHAVNHRDGQGFSCPLTCRKLLRWRISVSLRVAGMTTRKSASPGLRWVTVCLDYCRCLRPGGRLRR